MTLRIEQNETGKLAELYADTRLKNPDAPENRKIVPPSAPFGGDSIEISEEGHRLAAERNGNAAMSAEADQAASPESGSSDMDQVQKLREQIRELQEKIREAQERLLEAQTKSGTDGTNTDDDSALLQQNAMEEVLGQSAEVQQIQAEIEMLNQQLLTLNDQLKEAMQGQ